MCIWRWPDIRAERAGTESLGRESGGTSCCYILATERYEVRENAGADRRVFRAGDQAAGGRAEDILGIPQTAGRDSPFMYAEITTACLSKEC